jgi:START domain
MSDHDHLTGRVPREFSQSDSRHRFGRMVLLSFALFALLAHPSHASEWQSVDNTTDGIQIFRKEGSSGGLIAFRGIGVVEAPLPLVATVIFDTDRRREWVEGLVDSRILRWENKDNFIEYDHIEMPFFMNERDFVSKITMSFDPLKKQMVFHYRSSDDPSAPRTDYIRGEVIDMTFILSSIDKDRATRIDAAFLGDPKGWIPKWLVNFFLEDWPKRTFRNLRKEVLKSDLSVDTHFSTLLERGTIDR